MMKSALIAGLSVALVGMPLVVRAESPAPQARQPITFELVKAQADRIWTGLDINKDGRIDRADRDARMLEHFAKWDTNHDGVISKDEFLAHLHMREDKNSWHHPDPADPSPPPPPPPPPPPAGEHHGWQGPHPGGMVAMGIVGHAMHEARKDGAITRAAFDAAVKAEFDRIDTNHDGTLSREELRAAWHAEGRPGPEGWHQGPSRGHGHREAMPVPPPAGADGH